MSYSPFLGFSNKLPFRSFFFFLRIKHQRGGENMSMFLISFALAHRNTQICIKMRPFEGLYSQSLINVQVLTKSQVFVSRISDTMTLRDKSRVRAKPRITFVFGVCGVDPGLLNSSQFLSDSFSISKSAYSFRLMWFTSTRNRESIQRKILDRGISLRKILTKIFGFI